MQKTTQNQSEHKLWVKDLGGTSMYALERGQIIYCNDCEIIFQSDTSLVYREKFDRNGRFVTFYCLNCVRGLVDDGLTQTRIVIVMDNIKMAHGWRPVIPMKPALMDSPSVEPMVRDWTTNYKPSRNSGNPMNLLDDVKIGSVDAEKEVLLEDARQESFTTDEGLDYLDMLKDSSIVLGPNDIPIVGSLEHWKQNLYIEDRREEIIVPGYELIEDSEAKKELGDDL